MCIHIVVSPIKFGKIIRKNFIRMNLFHPNNNKCAAAVAAKSLQSCPTLDFTTTFETAGKISFFCLCVHACSVDSVVPDSLHSVDCRLPGFSILGTSQARILEWVAISFFRESSGPRDRTLFSCIGRQILYHWATWEAFIELYT